MKIILLGAPGCGKGTQSKLICERYNIPHISTGDLLRDAIKNNTPIGIKVKEYMSTLVPDEIVVGLVNDRLAQNDCKNGFVLDGFPRTIAQAKLFQEQIDAVLYFDIDLNEAKQRILNRRTCIKCGTIYTNINISTSTCNNCGGELCIREEDTKVDERLKTYCEFTYPLIEFYKKQNILKTINTDKYKNLTFEESVKNVFDNVIKELEG